MSIILKKLFVLIVFIIFFNCSTIYKFGKQFDQTKIEQITIGQTTMNQVQRLFGKPWRIGNINGNVVYTYSYEKVTFRADDTVTKEGNTLVIEFDGKGVVKTSISTFLVGSRLSWVI